MASPRAEAPQVLAFYAGPAIAMALLTFSVLMVLGYRRLWAIRRKQYPLRYFKLLQRPEGANFPEGAEAAARNLVNLFEMPVLFYGVVPLLIATGVEDDFALAALWAFTGFRALHSLIHLTINHLVARFFAYAASGAALFAVWLRFAQLLHG